MPMPGGWDSSKTDALARNSINSQYSESQGPSTYGVSNAGADTYPLGGAVSTATYVSPNMQPGSTDGSVFPGWEISIENT